MSINNRRKSDVGKQQNELRQEDSCVHDHLLSEES